MSRSTWATMTMAIGSLDSDSGIPNSVMTMGTGVVEVPEKMSLWRFFNAGAAMVTVYRPTNSVLCRTCVGRGERFTACDKL